MTATHTVVLACIQEMDQLATSYDTAGLERGLRLRETQELAERLMTHAVLRDARVVPTISKLQLLLGAIVFSRSEFSHALRDRVLAAMLLMYHGLAMHEEIDEQSHCAAETEQLTILGGDYLSSLFYRLLAETGRIDLIGLFSGAVARINVAKASLARGISDRAYTTDAYMQDAKTIHGGLLAAACHAVQSDALTVAFIDAAVTTSVYHAALERGSPEAGTTLARVLLSAALSEEERGMSALYAQTAQADRRLVSLHAKYGTIGKMVHALRESMARLQEAAVLLVGQDGWPLIRALFP
ncbi:MAG: heptaprenyl diphosphate synthase component 1, partial [Firmicutes bacterium]|nr:heptaprenyl diphosphate synthase component 1 [Bacillota bacterium]